MLIIFDEASNIILSYDDFKIIIYCWPHFLFLILLLSFINIGILLLYKKIIYNYLSKNMLSIMIIYCLDY